MGEPLPTCEGPKMDPFQFRNPSRQKITFIKHLGNGCHAYVFKVSIDDRIYALKLVSPSLMANLKSPS